MTGRLTTLTPDAGTIASATAKSCIYSFVRAQFYGDWDQLVADFGGGAVINVNFQRSQTPNVALTVRRLLATTP